MRVQTKRLNTWQQVVGVLREMPSSWCFRGQANSEWDLETSLHRACLGRNLPIESTLKMVEAKTITKWKRNAHRFVTSLPVTDLEWLSLMQHHGTPTRLLDWTMSPYVAAYFALESCGEACAIWALDLVWCVQRAEKNLGAGFLHQAIDSPYWSSPEYAQRLSTAPRGVYPVWSFRLNERINSQQGFFLFPADLTTTFVDNLMAYECEDMQSHIMKLEIPRSVRGEALQDLDRMTINREYLFPDLDGFAQQVIYNILKS